ncbi:hypothetical protein DPMN_050666 [Dreissena polymorpha]|uniref:Uncharacterized protein n=1 Tax=Dreissena polymorpha TaxID=45954 RepID=A0A9D4HMJ4_DREPO|nr:hypothetical protein DPMN_050666 [Dreissena polymorpha]
MHVLFGSGEFEPLWQETATTRAVHPAPIIPLNTLCPAQQYKKVRCHRIHGKETNGDEPHTVEETGVNVILPSVFAVHFAKTVASSSTSKTPRP